MFGCVFVVSRFLIENGHPPCFVFFAFFFLYALLWLASLTSCSMAFLDFFSTIRRFLPFFFVCVFFVDHAYFAERMLLHSSRLVSPYLTFVFSKLQQQKTRVNRMIGLGV